MQSDSDSDGEFFDAAESPSSSFTCELSKSKGSRKGNKEDEHSTDGLPQGKNNISTDTKSAGDRNVSCPENENKASSNEDANGAENGKQSVELNLVAHGEQTTQELEGISHRTAPVSTSGESDENALKENDGINEVDRTCEKEEESEKCSGKTAEQQLPSGDATAKVTVTPSARDVVADVVGKVSEETSETPVAPPRRRKKKKMVTAAEVEDPFSLEVQSAADKENKQPPGNETDLPSTSCIHQNFIKPKGLYEPSAASDDEDNPSIKVDANQQEMKEVLAKNSSTEVVSAAKLDERLKSPSATSLDSSKSDNYKSAASFTSIDAIKQTNSLSSLSQATPDGMVRYRSVSGRPLSDIEILEQVQVKNLDTGEAIPLSKAEECLPKCSNPLSMHIMRLTSEYTSSPDVSVQDREDGGEQMGRKVAKKTKRLKKFLGKTVNKIKSEVKVRQREDSSSSDEEGPQDSSASLIKIKSGHGKGPAEFERLKILQDLSREHVGAVWTIKFSGCGRLMATAGQDHMVRVWVLKEALSYFEEMRAKYRTGERSSPTNSETNSEEDASSLKENEDTDAEAAAAEDDPGPFEKSPFCTYCGHSGDVLDLSWSKNYFLLSSSMDKTVRLWHISRSECLCCFQHIDFVTAIVFHPRDDRYFLSGSLDGKIRLWNIPDKKVALWNEVEGTGNHLITAANFCLNGKFAVVGTYDGRCIFYETERLKYHTQWHIKTSRNRKSRGRKISGIEPMPGEDKVLITSNDSRLRLYDLKDNSLYCKYKGCTNTSSQIKGSFSHDGSYVICGSEDRFVYVWRTQHGIASARRDKNEFYESFSAHDAAVTAAVFAPVPWLIVPPDEVPTGLPVTSEVLVTADWSGAIKLFVNR